MAKANIWISVDNQHTGDEILKVAAAAELVGLQVICRFPKTGVIIGIVEADKVEAIRGIDGVIFAETNEAFHRTLLQCDTTNAS